MNALTRWNPTRELEDLGTEMMSLLERPLVDRSPFARVVGWPTPSGVARAMSGEERLAFNPLIDVEESSDGYHISCDLPGVKKKDVHVHVDGQNLVLEGERQARHEVKGARYARRELSYGRFHRSFRLPVEVDPSAVSAEMEDGTLHIKLPKTTKALESSREIKIK